MYKYQNFEHNIINSITTLKVIKIETLLILVPTIVNRIKVRSLQAAKRARSVLANGEIRNWEKPASLPHRILRYPLPITPPACNG